MADGEEFELAGINLSGKEEKDQEEPQQPQPQPQPKSKGRAKKGKNERSELEEIERILDQVEKKERGRERRPQQREPELLSKEEQIESQELCVKLCLYAEHPLFHDVLKTMKFDLAHTTLAKKTLKELKELYLRVTTTINSLMASNGTKDWVMQVIQWVEGYCVSNPKINDKVKLAGLAKALDSDKSFEQNIAILQIENCSQSTMNPSLRLASNIFMAGLGVHQANRIREQILQQPSSGTVAKEVEKKEEKEEDKQQKEEKEGSTERKIELREDTDPDYIPPRPEPPPQQVVPPPIKPEPEKLEIGFLPVLKRPTPLVIPDQSPSPRRRTIPSKPRRTEK